jgi:hypothetical protein
MKIRYSNHVFIETVQSLCHEFEGDTNNTLLLVGAINDCMVYDYDEFTKGYDRVILFNQEPYSSTLVQNRLDKYIGWMSRADEVWDYDESNMEFFNKHHVYPSLHVLKPYKQWDMYAPVNKDIDFLLYGTLSERRMNVVNFLREKYTVVTLDNLYGDELDSYILRSRNLLNIHVWPENYSIYQEQARMVRWLGAPCRIISEKSAHNYLGVPEMEYWELFLL